MDEKAVMIMIVSGFVQELKNVWWVKVFHYLFLKKIRKFHGRLKNEYNWLIKKD